MTQVRRYVERREEFTLKMFRASSSSDTVDSAFSAEQFKTNRASEREQMQHLNERFATYISNVLRLEQQNKCLIAELEQLKAKGTSCVGDLYEEEMTQLRHQVDQLTKEKNKAEMERDKLQDDLSMLREK